MAATVVGLASAVRDQPHRTSRPPATTTVPRTTMGKRPSGQEDERQRLNRTVDELQPAVRRALGLRVERLHMVAVDRPVRLVLWSPFV